MATDKNITMKQFNGTDYDTLYPKTIASQIPDVYSKSYIDSILKDNARIQTGSYVGTGTYGASNPCSLTFDFVPIFCIIYGSKWSKTTGYNIYSWGSVDSQCAILYTNFLTNEYKPYFIQEQSAPSGEGYAKMIGTTYFWYHSGGASYQFNRSTDYTYYYLAIG